MSLRSRGDKRLNMVWTGMGRKEVNILRFGCLRVGGLAKSQKNVVQLRSHRALWIRKSWQGIRVRAQ